MEQLHQAEEENKRRAEHIAYIKTHLLPLIRDVAKLPVTEATRVLCGMSLADSQRFCDTFSPLVNEAKVVAMTVQKEGDAKKRESRAEDIYMRMKVRESENFPKPFSNSDFSTLAGECHFGRRLRHSQRPARDYTETEPEL